MSIPEKNPIGGVWPLGTFTITAGTPISLLSIVGQRVLGQGAFCRQFIISTAGNTGEIYLNDGNVAGKDVNRTVAIIGPAEPSVGVPPDALRMSEMDVTRYYVDGSASGDTVTISAADSRG
jgi:hypothetical protein